MTHPSSRHATDVLVVGGGPAGLLLAHELRVAGVNVMLIERQKSQPDFCRGFNLNARALDLLSRRNLAKPLLAEGWQVPRAAFTGLPVTLSMDGVTTDHPFSLGIPQTRVEEFLEQRIIELGADLRRGHTLHALCQHELGVTATVAAADRELTVEAKYLVGCDGSRSTVRQLAGIEFPGTPATHFMLLGDVELAHPAAISFGLNNGPGGSVTAIPRPGYVRLLTEDRRADVSKDTPVTPDVFEEALQQALGRPVAFKAARWLTRFGDAARQAVRYVSGRLMLAGDAAHIFPPSSANGVSVALDDAFNLGWKLAAVVNRTAPEQLLETYHSERHAIGAQIVDAATAQITLARGGPALNPLRTFLTEIANHPHGNRAFTEVVTRLSTCYDMPDGATAPHPWLGRFVPDLELSTEHGVVRLASLFAEGRGLLLYLSNQEQLLSEAAGWADRLTIVSATCAAHPAIASLLLRPDGHACWVSTSSDFPAESFRNAASYWFGAPQKAVHPDRRTIFSHN